MLKELYISNIAIIRSERVCPGARLTVLTGETGAGKSIIIDSVGLIMGERASRELLRTGEEKATVSALFEAVGAEASGFAAELGIEPEDGALLLQRDITDKGVSSARINGRTVPLSIMRELAERLISIHGQHDGQNLLDEDKHIDYLDAFAGLEPELRVFSAKYDDLLRLNRNIRSLSLSNSEKVRRIALL